MNIHSVSLKGRRDSNEDKHNIILNEDGKNNAYLPVNFFGVYDGHGGKFVSAYLSKNLQNYFMAKCTVNYPLSKKYIYDTYNTIQNDLTTKHRKEALHCGSTCLAAVHAKVDEKYYITLFNTGDCRAVLCRDNIAIPLTKDHKPHWPEERFRIQQLGGNIHFDGEDHRIKDLSVSRAFGDIDAHPYVTCTPDVYKYRIDKNDKFMIMACDGLWDKLSNQEVVNFILIEGYDISVTKRNTNASNIAKKLGEYAIQKGSTDNITIIIIFFH